MKIDVEKECDCDSTSSGFWWMLLAIWILLVTNQGYYTKEQAMDYCLETVRVVVDEIKMERQ